MTGRLLVVSLLILVLGCEQQSSTSSSTDSTTTPPAATSGAPTDAQRQAMQEMAQAGQSAADGALPPGHPPIDGSAAGGASTDSDGDLPAGHPPIGGAESMGGMGAMGMTPPSRDLAVVFDTPEAWEAVEPQSSMRVFEYKLPGDGDEAGVLTAFVFPAGGGGGIAANVERWRGQFRTATGEPLPDENVTEEKREINGLPVTLIDMRGTFSAGAMTFGGEAAEAAPETRMFGALIEAPDQLIVLKATGPVDLMAKYADAWMAYIESVRPAAE